MIIESECERGNKLQSRTHGCHPAHRKPRRATARFGPSGNVANLIFYETSCVALNVASSGFVRAERMFSATFSISLVPQNGSFHIVIDNANVLKVEGDIRFV
jgi:hypothetical protein